MPAKSHEALSAKLRPPRLLRAIERERLFDWIDARRATTAIWLSGPPGSGKTTLIASYLRARGLRSLWYRFDADDTDAARFYATLGEAVDAMRAGVERPAFAAEHLQRPREFARRWFLAVCAGLPRPVVFVFDNVEQAAMPALNAVIAEAIDEAPAGVSFLVTCRHAPDATFGPALLSGLLCELPAAELRFDAHEVAAYAREFDLEPVLAERAARRVQGWAAGLRLLSHTADPSKGGELA